MMLVPNAADASWFDPQQPRDKALMKELNISAGVPVVGFAGSIVGYEGFDLLLNALALLQNRSNVAKASNGTAVDFVFLLVGGGDEGTVNRTKYRTAELGLESHVRFTGRVPYDKVQNYMALMDIMPVPRLSLPVTEMVSALKPLEAMAMGKAVVLSDVAPHRTMAGVPANRTDMDYISESNRLRARLFAKGNATALADAIEALIVNPKERARLGRAGRRWVEVERNWDAVTQVYSRGMLEKLNGSLADADTPAKE